MSVLVNGVQQSVDQYFFDARGRTTNARTWTSALNAFRSFGYVYDSADRLNSLTYPTGESVTTGYEAAWRPISLCSNQSGCYIDNASYTAWDAPLVTWLHNGRQEIRAYDDPSGH